MSDLIISQTTIRINADGLYCLNDLHKASGGENNTRPKYWTDMDSTKKFIEFCKSKAEGGKSPSVLSVIKGGKNQGTYACKKLPVRRFFLG